jgi:sugar transferase (PEP-CTERM/EpsH1 system associated)
MKVLFVTTRIPHPPWRGDQVRSWNLLRHLARRHDITLAAVTVGRPSRSALEAVAGLGVTVESIPLWRTGTPLALAGGLFSSTPFQVLLHGRRRARSRVASLVKKRGFDLVHGQLVRSAPYLPEVGPPVVIDLIDALSANFAKRATFDRIPIKWVAGVEARRLDAYEAKVLGRVDAAVVVSPDDREALGDPSVHVIPNGVDLGAFPMAVSGRDPERIVFAGSLGYFPNVDAATFLAREVMPHVWEQRPLARLHLVGARPARAVQALADDERVILTADVPDIAPHVASAAVAVIPMRAGSGMQNKVVEAMALGTPVVTTPQAGKAVGATPHEHLLVAREARNIAAEALALMADPAEAAALAGRARQFVEDRFRWKMAADAMDSVWHEVAR